MIPDRIIRDFKQQKLHIDLFEMSLVQSNAGEKAITYKGKGYIQQTSDDLLTFKLYSNETLNTNFGAHFDRFNRMRSGEIYSDDSYYILSGFATDGTSWKADHVLPNCDWPPEEANPIVHGRLSSIMGGELPSSPDSLAMHFFEKVDLPVPIREVKFTAAGYEFHVEKDDDSFVVKAKSGDPLPKYFAMRVEEALRFLLAQSVTPRAIVQAGSVVLISRMLKSSIVQLGPPLCATPAPGGHGGGVTREVAQAGLLMI